MARLLEPGRSGNAEALATPEQAWDENTRRGGKADKGSRRRPVPERIRSPLDSIDVRDCSEDQLVAMRARITTEIGRRFGDPDEPTRPTERLRLLARLSFDEADLRKRRAGNGPLLGLTDYFDFKPPWGVSKRQIYKLYDGIAAAIADADLMLGPSPRRGLSVLGHKRPGSPPRTWESSMRDLAEMFEQNRGRSYSQEDYDLFAVPAGRARYQVLLQVAKRERGWTGRDTFPRMRAEALRLILTEWLDDYPRTVSYRRLVETAGVAGKAG